MEMKSDRNEARLSGRQPLRRLFDILLSSCLIILLSPLLFVICFLIKIESPGPILIWLKRIGWNGHTITLRKFRTMYIDSESMVISQQSLKADPRVTPVGRFLRRSSFDELPQLFDVLSGQLTFIGPRPILPYETTMVNPD